MTRTTGEFLDSNRWHYKNGTVTIIDAEPYHEYSVNFLVYQTWDTTSMYNAITNNWSGDKVMCVDPYTNTLWTISISGFPNIRRPMLSG